MFIGVIQGIAGDLPLVVDAFGTTLRAADKVPKSTKVPLVSRNA